MAVEVDVVQGPLRGGGGRGLEEAAGDQGSLALAAALKRLHVQLLAVFFIFYRFLGLLRDLDIFDLLAFFFCEKAPGHYPGLSEVQVRS